MTNIPNHQIRQLTAQVADTAVRFATRPGFPGWDSVSPTIELLVEGLDATKPDPSACIAVLGCGHAAIATMLAQRLPLAQFTLLEQSAVALEAAAATLALNQGARAQIEHVTSLLHEHAGTFDRVLLDLPQSRQLARRWLLEAHGLLRMGGQLILAGPNELGIQSVIDDAAALFGGAALVAYRRKCRVVRAARQEHTAPPAWASEPGIAPGTWREVALPLATGQASLATQAGVFAHDRIDDGTALLLKHLPDVRGLRVLDLGCGYGPIGIAAGLTGAARVDLCDASLLAVACASENLRRHQIVGEALAGDGLAPVRGRRYDLILSNPPFHSGKQVSYDTTEAFIREARKLLMPRGRLMLVANRFIRYDRLIAEVFGACQVLADDRRYWVLAAHLAP